MSTRFFHAAPITAERVTLDGPEAHHLLHVRRAAKGEEVVLFDGSGMEFPAVVDKLGRSTVELRIVARREAGRELPFPLVAGIALPKGDRQKWLVEKLTELGVTTLVPLATERGVAQPTAGTLERLRRTVVEASKQCGRNRLMEVFKPQAWTTWARNAPRADGVRLLFAHPAGLPLGELLTTAPRSVYIAIGPEGGFTDAEVNSGREAGWHAVALGPRILRVETAAVALAAAIALR